MIKKEDSGLKLMGPSLTPVKYSSVPTRYASLHSLQNGAEFNEDPIPLASMVGEIPQDYKALNIRSGVNITDCPSYYGETKYGLRKIAGLTFTPENTNAGWKRNRGEW